MASHFSPPDRGGSMGRWALALVVVGGVLALGTSARLSHAQRGFGVKQQQPAPVFSNPTAITNPYLPLAGLNLDILEGVLDGEAVHIERRTLNGVTKPFMVNGQRVEALVMEDREYFDGKLKEITFDYFAQSDDGAVYYLGEDVDVFKDGRIVSHEGAWLYGVNTKVLGVIMPANPKVGDMWRLEDVPGITIEDDKVLSTSETITVPAGTYTNVLKIEEKLSATETDYKYHASGVGVIKEVSGDGEVNLISHR